MPGYHIFKTKAKYFIILLLIFYPLIAGATNTEEELPAFNKLFYNFNNNLLQSFSNAYGMYHAAAAGLSLSLVKGGADWRYYSFMADNKFIPRAAFAAVFAGGLVPLTVPIYLYFNGRSEQDRQLMYTSLALGQSIMLSLLVSSAYKAFTGRKGPEILDDTGRPNDYSGDFNFGFFRRGIFDGWPSGHTTTAFAMAVSLMEMYPDNNDVKIYSGIYALFIGLGVSTNIHWFSDFVAGALIGYSIGKSVGSSFKNLMNGKEEQSMTSFYLIPSGAGLIIRF